MMRAKQWKTLSKLEKALIRSVANRIEKLPADEWRDAFVELDWDCLPQVFHYFRVMITDNHPIQGVISSLDHLENYVLTVKSV